VSGRTGTHRSLGGDRAIRSGHRDDRLATARTAVGVGNRNVEGDVRADACGERNGRSALTGGQRPARHDEEDKTKPLSDDALVEQLAKNGIKVARRTVTKYRKAMNIPSSRQRRDWTKVEK